MSVNALGDWPRQTRDQWCAQLRQENPGKDCSDYLKSVFEGVISDPFTTVAGRPQSGHICLSPGAALQWKPGVHLLLDNEEVFARSLAICLANGVEYLSVRSSYLPTLVSLERLFEGVHLSYITLRWSCTNPQQDPGELLGFLKERTTPGQAFATIPGLLQHPFCAMEMRLVLGDPVAIAKGISTCLRLVQHDSPQPINCIVSLELGEDFLRNLYLIRAIRLVLIQIDIAYPGLFLFYLEGHFVAGKLAEDPYKNMIALSTAAVSAVLAEIDFLSLPSASYQHQEDHDRWLRSSLHLQHILIREARLQGMRDVLAGAPYIEQMTRQCADRIWAELLKALEP